MERKCRICGQIFQQDHKLQIICRKCIDRTEKIMKKNWVPPKDGKSRKGCWHPKRTTCIICGKPLNPRQGTVCCEDHATMWRTLKNEVYRKWGLPLPKEPQKGHKKRNSGRRRNGKILKIKDFHNDNLSSAIANAKLSGMSYGEYMSKKRKEEVKKYEDSQRNQY